MNENYSNNKLLTIFNLTSVVTVSTLERKSTEKKCLCTKYYNMNQVASSTIRCLNRKKRRLIASFYLKQKPIYFMLKIARRQNLSNSKFGYCL